jgi:hypothetical protein
LYVGLLQKKISVCQFDKSQLIETKIKYISSNRFTFSEAVFLYLKQKGEIMKTGLTKRQKDTVICFNEESDIIDVRTHNTDLRNRLLEFSEQYPDCCKLTDDDGQGGMLFEIQKGRLSFRLTAPYSDERRNSLSENAKKHGINSD